MPELYPAASRSENLETPGKAFVRSVIRRALLPFSQSQTKLTGVWLSGDTFGDLRPLLPCFEKVVVCEHEKTSWLKKRESLETDQKALQLVELYPLGPVQTYLCSERYALQVGNLDFCCHFCPWVMVGVNGFFRRTDRKAGSYLFLTVCQKTPIQMVKGMFTLLGSTPEAISSFVRTSAGNYRLEATPLPGLEGFGYRNGGAIMFAFGWRLQPISRRRYEKR